MTDHLNLKMVEPETSASVDNLDAESQSALELMAMAMFADKRVLASEIQAFVVSVKSLQDQLVLKTRLSEAEIIVWYETHKSVLSDVIVKHQFESWMEQQIAALMNFPDKHLLLRAMDDIARSDGEKHISETALETLTAQKWAAVLLEKYPRKWVA